jgi:hypothetical protein
MVSLVNGGFSTRLGFHVVNTEERGRELTPERGMAVSMGWPAWAFLGSVSAQLYPCSISCTLDHWPIQLWALDIIISATKLRILCMNFRSFHLGPREFSIQARWSLPPFGASSHMVRVSVF